MMRARFDKAGKRLDDTGFGCGCQLCADTNAPRYERRRGPRTQGDPEWSPLRRRLVHLVEGLRPAARSQVG